MKTESCKAAIDTVALRLIGDTASRNGCPTPRTPTAPQPRLAAQHPLRFRQVRLHGACQQQVSTLIAFLHCDLVRKALVAKLGVRLQIRAKSLYQLFEVIQFLKLLNRSCKGPVFIRANPSGDCPRAERYFSRRGAAPSPCPRLLIHGLFSVCTL